MSFSQLRAAILYIYLRSAMLVGIYSQPANKVAPPNE